MAHAVIGGITTSTVLTLVVVPVLYTYMDSLGRWFTGRFTSADEHESKPVSAPHAAD